MKRNKKNKIIDAGFFIGNVAGRQLELFFHLLADTD